MEKNCMIYKIVNKTNYLTYVGQTIHPEKRFKQHKNMLESNSHYNLHLQHSWNKYGEENFCFEILEYCEKEKLNERELFYIEAIGSLHPNGYNLVNRGSNISMSEETRKKISLSAKERLSIPSNHPMFGKKQSMESKIKNSDSNKKRIWKPEWKENLDKNVLKGEECPSAKLKSSDIPDIRGLLSTMGDIEISNLYSVSPACIWKIRLGKSWVTA